jgi:hypothetical protein
MAENIDWKKLGLGVKDLLVGVVTVAGGATGGAAGAQGGQQAGKGLDKILNMAGVSEEGNETPSSPPAPASVAERFDKADNHKALPPPSPPEPPSSAEQERIAARHVLSASGWTPEEIEILLLGKTPKSRALLGVVEEGSRVPTAVGIKLPTKEETT